MLVVCCLQAVALGGQVPGHDMTLPGLRIQAKRLSLSKKTQHSRKVTCSRRRTEPKGFAGRRGP